MHPKRTSKSVFPRFVIFSKECAQKVFAIVRSLFRAQSFIQHGFPSVFFLFFQVVEVQSLVTKGTVTFQTLCNVT